MLAAVEAEEELEAIQVEQAAVAVVEPEVQAEELQILAEVLALALIQVAQV